MEDTYWITLYRRPTGVLLRIFSGGLHRGMITQMYGESGTGKTQLCMQLMLGAARHRVPVLYISTEKRMHA